MDKLKDSIFLHRHCGI